MRYHCVVPLLGAAANILICILVLRQGIRDKLHRAFAWMGLAIVSWNLDIFALYYFTDREQAEWWSRLFRTGICLAPPIVFHFALVLSRSHGRIWRGLLFGGYAGGIVLAVANLHGELVERLTPHTWGWYVEPTPLYTGLTVSLVVFLLLSAERVLHTHRHPETPRQRVQAEFWLLASAIQVPSALTNLLPLYGFSTYPLGNIGNVFFVGIIAYAIARHRLMDVDYVVRKGVSFSLASAVVLVPGGLGLGMLTRDLGVEAPLVIVCAAISLALVAVILIPTLQEAMETRVQRAFFPHLHDYRRRLRELAAMLVHVLDQRKLLRRLGDALIDILSLESCHAFVHDEETRRLSLAYPSGDGETLPDDVALALETIAGPILAPELESTSPLAAAYFRARGWEVGIPLRSNRGLTGFVALGQNKDFRIFSGEDLQLLSTVAAGASVALENASLSRQLRHSEIVLERANRLSSLGMLAAGIAHEIRNPLVAVKTFLDLLPQRLDDREFMSSFRDLSLAELKRVTNLITDLLALGKSTTAERKAVELGATVEPVARLMESTARKRGVELRCTLARALPTVWADPDQLKQILLNLLLNAIEVSPNGATVTLDVRTPRASDTVVLEVRDEGPGIPPDQLKNIFHPFFTTKETGTGLGLALVHQMVVEHGGEISVESDLGRGSVFRVTLPTAQPAQVELAETGT
jgi:signal transduction histidine kinase